MDIFLPLKNVNRQLTPRRVGVTSRTLNIGHHDKYDYNETIWSTAGITKMWQRYELSKCYRKNSVAAHA